MSLTAPPHAVSEMEEDQTERHVVLVTGAARRIGASLARHFHARGWNVVIHFNTSKNEAMQLAHELNSLRACSAVTLQADLSSLPTDEMANGLVERATATWRRLDLLVNNASIFSLTSLENCTEESWDAVMTVNLKAPYFLTKAAAPYLGKRSGSVVNICDVYGERPLSSFSHYCISKAGLAMQTKALAVELAPFVRVNSVSPGAILKPNSKDIGGESEEDFVSRIKIPMQRMGETKDVCKVVEFLACDAPFMTGHNLVVDGGQSLGI